MIERHYFKKTAEVRKAGQFARVGKYHGDVDLYRIDISKFIEELFRWDFN